MGDSDLIAWYLLCLLFVVGHWHWLESGQSQYGAAPDPHYGDHYHQVWSPGVGHGQSWIVSDPRPGHANQEQLRQRNESDLNICSPGSSPLMCPFNDSGDNWRLTQISCWDQCLLASRENNGAGVSSIVSITHFHVTSDNNNVASAMESSASSHQLWVCQ